MIDIQFSAVDSDKQSFEYVTVTMLNIILLHTDIVVYSLMI